MPTIVLTNWMLSGRSGMETYTRDLALGLKRRGWSPMIFSLHTGPLAVELRAAGVPVLTRVEELPRDVTIIHGHHNFMTVMALLACPAAMGLFVCHTSLFWQEEAPVFPRIMAYAGVDDLCRERVAADLKAPLETVRFIGNSVDMARFAPRGQLPKKPRRALLFSNYAAEHTFLPVVREACWHECIALDVIGSGVLNQVPDPERVLQDYDLVFAKARCAMESLATGCATVLCGMEGIGPLVTMENFARLRRDNFGRRCLSLPMNVENLIASIRQYDAPACDEVACHARFQLDLECTLDQWIALYEEVLTLPCPTNPETEAVAAANMLAKLAPPLFRTFELESARDYLQHGMTQLTASQFDLQNQLAQAGTQAGVQKETIINLRAELKQMQKKCNNPREAGRNAIALKGPLAWLWHHRTLRPIARALGIRDRTGR